MSHFISLVLLFLATCTYVAIATAISRAASQCIPKTQLKNQPNNLHGSIQ